MPDWIRRLFETIDAKDADGFVSFLTEDAQFRFGNAPEVTGKGDVREAVAEFFASINAIRHRILDVWVHPDTVICQGDVTYTRLDDSQITVPFVTVFRMKGDLVGRYLVYGDMTPLRSA